MIDVLFVCLYMQVQFLRKKFSSLDIEVDGGLSPSTIDTAAQVCVCVCVSYNHFFPPSLFPKLLFNSRLVLPMSLKLEN